MAENIVLFDAFVRHMESSSSSSEEEEIISLCKRKGKKNRIKNYLNTIMHFPDKQFKNFFRIEKLSADDLIRRFGGSELFNNYAKSDHGGSHFISAESHVLSFLWFAANKCVLRDVSERFDVGESTLFRMVNRVMDYLLSIADQIIQFPETVGKKLESANNFLKVAGFPNVIGIIDGSSIPIRTPAHKIKSTYCNRHDIVSVTLQGVCNWEKKFIDVFTGPPGKIHDSRVYKMSYLSRKLPALSENKYYILGDSAYSIREWLLTPYRNYGNLTNQEKKFNKKFCATRVLIENTFGLFKNRFRQLLKLEFHEVNKITKFIISCCVIHNICIDYDDLIELENIIDDNNFDEYIENELLPQREVLLKVLGEIKRDEISALLNNVQ